MTRDPITGETFLRIVGRRAHAPLGEPPPAETRRALGEMARYLTRAPKGVFFYRDHDEMDADRLRWLVQAVVEHERGG